MNRNVATSIIENPEMLKIQQQHQMKKALEQKSAEKPPPPPLIRKDAVIDTTDNVNCEHSVDVGTVRNEPNKLVCGILILDD